MSAAPRRMIDARPVREVGGEAAVPGDKSISHRAILLSALAEGTSEVRGFLPSEDCLASLAAMRALGVRIEQPGPTEVRIEGVGLRGLKAAPHALDMGNAGTAMRLFAGLLSAQAFDSRLIGDESLMRRPMERVAAPLREMGAAVRTHEGRPPVEIGGGRRLRGIDYRMPVASAQVKSAILLAALYADGATTVTAPAVCRDHSERMLAGAGVRIETRGLATSLEPPARLSSQSLDVPGDFSSAAFFLVAGLLGAAPEGLLLRNVGLNPTRTGLLDILRAMGGRIEVENPRRSGAEPTADLRVHASALRGIAVPAELVPLAIDEFPVLFIAAACADGETVVSGAEELRVKESDRIAAVAGGFAALGVEHAVLPDGLRIRGRARGPAFRGGTVDSAGDHRIAMAFSVASLRAEAPIAVRDTANVATSFPGFVTLARAVGLDLAEREDSPAGRRVVTGEERP
jgi:3-phosphoshikimate 1-carboxyvinyltransferase